MVWFFEKHGTYIRCETRDGPNGTYELVICNPDGSEQIEHFTDSAALTRRQQELEFRLTGDGWQGPFGRTI